VDHRLDYSPNDFTSISLPLLTSLRMLGDLSWHYPEKLQMVLNFCSKLIAPILDEFQLDTHVRRNQIQTFKQVLNNGSSPLKRSFTSITTLKIYISSSESGVGERLLDCQEQEEIVEIISKLLEDRAKAGGKVLILRNPVICHVTTLRGLREECILFTATAKNSRRPQSQIILRDDNV